MSLQVSPVEDVKGPMSLRHGGDSCRQVRSAAHLLARRRR
jgi:hypothetical protein